MKRKLFCEISPLTYKISTQKEILRRKIKDMLSTANFSSEKSSTKLPYVIYTHKSLIRRKLGQVDQQLQENKAINLSIAAPKVNNVLIKPNETFSFWHLVGPLSASLGYKEGLTVANDSTSSGIGGGMCQFTNLIHWMILHSPLIITEHHHHDNLDLFPDFGRQVPFGTGTSIVYNYLDYRFYNPTPYIFQLITATDARYLCGELRCDHQLPYSYHIKCEDEFFSKEDGVVYRNNKVFRRTIDKVTGKTIKQELIKANHARVLYDTTNLPIKKIINGSR